MTKTMETTDLAGVLSQAARELEEADALAQQAAEARAKAEAARLKADAEQQAARRRWAEGAMAGYDDRRRQAYAALTAAETAWQQSPTEPATVLPAWQARERARAVLFGVELERERAAGILGHSPRAAKVPRPDLTGDLAALLNGWALEQLSAADEAVREAVAAATTGRATDAV